MKIKSFYIIFFLFILIFCSGCNRSYSYQNCPETNNKYGKIPKASLGEKVITISGDSSSYLCECNDLKHDRKNNGFVCTQKIENVKMYEENYHTDCFKIDEERVLMGNRENFCNNIVIEGKTYMYAQYVVDKDNDGYGKITEKEDMFDYCCPQGNLPPKLSTNLWRIFSISPYNDEFVFPYNPDKLDCDDTNQNRNPGIEGSCTSAAIRLINFIRSIGDTSDPIAPQDDLLSNAPFCFRDNWKLCYHGEFCIDDRYVDFSWYNPDTDKTYGLATGNTNEKCDCICDGNYYEDILWPGARCDCNQVILMHDPTPDPRTDLPFEPDQRPQPGRPTTPASEELESDREEFRQTCGHEPLLEGFCYFDSNGNELRVPIPEGEFGCNQRYNRIEECVDAKDNCYKSNIKKECTDGFCYGPNGENDGSGPVCKYESFCELSDGSNRKLPVGKIVCSDSSSNIWYRCRRGDDEPELFEGECEQGEFCNEGSNQICSPYCSEKSNTPNSISYEDLADAGSSNPFIPDQTRCTEDGTRAVLCYENGLSFGSPGGYLDGKWPFTYDGWCEQHAMTCIYGPRKDLHGKSGAQCVCQYPNEVEELIEEYESKTGDNYLENIPDYLYSCGFWCEKESEGYAIIGKRSCDTGSDGIDRIVTCTVDDGLTNSRICYGDGMVCLTSLDDEPFCGCEGAPEAIMNEIKKEGYQEYEVCPFWCEYEFFNEKIFAMPGEKVCSSPGDGREYISICQLGGNVYPFEECKNQMLCEQDCDENGLCTNARCV